ncbi:MAG TPA: glycosyltransferase [Candidatus Cybelea sp.]|jgi:glycosyltransferase involved in cell wall biosynthesis|nr:glycosyltransferase [Candidatus Cybelea sp.]
MEPLRLGFFTEIYRPVVNGVVASVESLADGLRARGHEVYCFAPRIPGYEEADGPVFRMPSLPLPTRTPYRLTLPLVSRRNLNTVIKRLSLVHVHSPFVTGWMGVRYARRYGMPLVYTYHTQLEAYAHYVPFEANATRFAAAQLTRTFANTADAVVVPTPAMATRLRELGVTVRIEVVPSGIDLAHFGSGRRDSALRSRIGIGANDRMILYVGRLAREKNVELLLAALARAGDESLKLVIAGDGPHRADLERRSAEAGVDRAVRFLGVVARDELPGLYASADAFVMPSTTETQGLVIAEAMAAGAYVIAAEAPQNRDVLASAGRIVSPVPEAFAAALREVPVGGADSEPTRQGALRFSLEGQLDRMELLYQNLLETARIA